MLQSGSRHSSIAIEFLRPYLLLTFVYMGGIYWLSSLPNLGIKGVDTDLLHIPLYAGLAFCLLNAMSEAQPQQATTWRLPGFAFVATTVCAVMDEWHQSFVPGRDASVGDISLDLLGISLMLVLSRL